MHDLCDAGVYSSPRESPYYAYRVDACKEIPLEIHGMSYLSTECEDKGPGIVLGRWKVNQHDADCMPFWNWYTDKICVHHGDDSG